MSRKLISIFSVVVMVTTVFSIGAIAEDYPPNMVSWWKLDDDYLDSQDGNHGSGHGNLAFIDGKIGRAVAFDGDYDYVSIGDNDNLDKDLGSTMSISFWFKTNDADAGQCFVTKYDHTEASYFSALISGQIRFAFYSSGGYLYPISTNAFIEGDRWYHVVGLTDGTLAGTKIYLDNNKLDIGFNNAGTFSTIMDTNAPVRFGTAEMTDGPIIDLFLFLNGAMDDVHIFSKALSEDEIDYLHSLGSYKPIADAGDDQKVLVTELVEFDGSGSSEPNGTIEKYEWDFDSDGIFDYTETSDNAPDGNFDGKTTYAYTESGLKTVTLQVTNDIGNKDQDECTIKVIGEIYIRADGTITDDEYTELTPPITVKSRTYTLTGNIYASIIIEKDGITLDGNLYTLNAPKADYDGYGITLSAREFVTVRDLTIENFEKGIYIDYLTPNPAKKSGGSQHNVIGNTFRNNKEAIYILKSKGDLIRENTIYTPTDGRGIIFEGTSKSYIADNEFRNGVGSTGIFILDDSDHNNIVNNRMHNKRDSQGIFLYSSSENTIKDNYFTEDGSGSWDGLSIMLGQKNHIYGNTLLRCTQGIYFYLSNRNIVNNNHIIMKGEDTLLNYGIVIEGFGNLVIENLIEEMTQSNGIGLIDGFYNTICWNRVYTYLGIYLKNSNANDIVGNIFMDEDSAYGLRSYKSWDNNIVGNNFWSSILCLDIDDAEGYFFCLNLFVGDIQIGDISDSLWSNLFMEGNCWGDYTGIDTDNDGIGNTEVPHNNVDLFPLMEIETIDVSYLINVFENRINTPQKSKEKYLRILNRAQKFIDAGKTTNAIRALESFQKLVSEEWVVPEMSPSSDKGTYLNWICDFIIYDLEYP